MASESTSATYPPLDTLKPVAANVFIVDSALSGPMGKVLGARMTVIRLSTGDVLLHSPTRYSSALEAEVRALGPIAHLVAPSFAHWIFLQDWQPACPNATTWAAPGLRDRAPVRKSGVRLDFDLAENAPTQWGDEIKLIMIPGGFNFHEAALFHAPSRTLVLTDFVINLEPSKLPGFMRPIVRWFGSVIPAGMPPPYLRGIIKLQRSQASRAAARLLALEPEQVIFSHGRIFESNGTQQLRQSLRWLVD